MRCKKIQILKDLRCLWLPEFRGSMMTYMKPSGLCSVGVLKVLTRSLFGILGCEVSAVCERSGVTTAFTI
jgi:hypothetical protein